MVSKLQVYAAVDPGPHCALAMKIGNQYVTVTYLDPNEMYDAIKQNTPQIMAIEVFFTSNRVDKYMIQTIEQVGGVRAICRVLGIPVYGQMPGAQKSFVQEAYEILKLQKGQLDLSKQGDDHELQALAHCMLLEYRVRQNEVRDQGSWSFAPGAPRSSYKRRY